MIQASESKPIRLAIAGVSLLALGLIAAVLWFVPDGGAARGPGTLPSVNAACNGASAVCLGIGWWMIRRQRETGHRRAMLAALGFSAAFFVGYLVHHARVGHVEFAAGGWLKTLYFMVLVPHVVLAALLVPLSLVTVLRGLTGRREMHRRIARLTLPVWLFVSTSGVAVYGLLYHS